MDNQILDLTAAILATSAYLSQTYKVSKPNQLKIFLGCG